MSEVLLPPPIVPLVQTVTPPPVVSAPIPAAPAASTEELPIEIQDDERSTFWRDFLYTSPTWGISMFLHACLVLALALHGLTEIPKHGSSVLTVSTNDVTNVETDLHEDALPPPESMPVVIESSSPPEAHADVSLAAPERLMPGDLPSEDATLAEVGDSSDFILDASMLKGFDDRTAAGNATTFFGVKSKGKKFCFVVDNSGSMRGAKFKSALYELATAIDKLKADQSFYIIFFSDQPYPLFYPNTVPTHVPAIPKNKQLLAQWLPTIELQKSTKGKESIEMALDLSPDVIYILGDGEFTDGTVKALMAREYIRTKIYTIGFNMKDGSRAAKDFDAIAQRFYGVYRSVNEPGK